MYLLSQLNLTYENNQNCIGQFESREFGKGDKAYSREITPLLPIFHSTQHSQITLLLDKSGNLTHAKLNAKGETNTIIPATEASAGRTSGLSPHPLCDKLQYVAGDYLQFVREGKTGKPAKSGYSDYIALLSSWVEFDPKNLYLQAILAFVKQGNLIGQISSRFPDILPISSDGAIITKWEDKTKEAPPIFKLTAPATPSDAFIRWEVEIPGEVETRVWRHAQIYQSWMNFVISQDSEKGLCFVTGKEASLAKQHPAKIRNAGDGAKIISSNDLSGFTFRGRFREADEVCSIGSEVTQKAHNALRWLISKQGWTDGSLAIVAWSAGDTKVPQPLTNTDSFWGDDEEPSNFTEEVVARKLSDMIKGYGEKLEHVKDRNDILILGLDSASPGRLSIIYFQELPPSTYLDHIQHWHTHCSWSQHFSKARQFIGAPTPRDIAEAAYGGDMDEKLRRQIIRRLLPCIIEKQAIPKDIVTSCIRRTSNRIACEWWEWEKILGITCALYRYQNINQQHYSMTLDNNITDRSYLYGRLLAVAEREENYALWLNGESRSTNAEKLMLRFSERPHSTWCILEKKLNPYRLIIKKRRDSEFFKNLIGDIIQSFVSEQEIMDDSPLAGDFLIGYYCQRADLVKGKNTELTPTEPEEQQTSIN